jgi:hypothetical protein
MSERLMTMDDGELEGLLRALGRELDVPGGRDLAAEVGQRLTTARPAVRRIVWFPRPARLRWSVVLAAAALLLVTAIAVAAIVGVPGIRVIFLPAASPPVSAAPTQPRPSGEPGARLGIGEPTALEAVPAAIGFEPRLPAPNLVGPPDATYVEDERATFVWAPRPDLPATADQAVGLLLTEFRGELDPGYYEKAVISGTSVEPVTIGDARGYWMSGEEHWLWYRDETGRVHEDTVRVVGDVLFWFDGELTYRLETSLGRDAAIRIAESISQPEPDG